MSGADRARNRYAQALAGEEMPFVKSYIIERDPSASVGMTDTSTLGGGSIIDTLLELKVFRE